MDTFRIIVRGSKEYIASLDRIRTTAGAVVVLLEKIENGSLDKYLAKVWKKFTGQGLDYKSVWESLPGEVVIFQGEAEVYSLEFSGGKREIICAIKMDIAEMQG